MTEITFPEGFDATCTSEHQRAGKMLGIALTEVKKLLKSGTLEKSDIRPFIDLMDDSIKLTVDDVTEVIEQYFTIV